MDIKRLKQLSGLAPLVEAWGEGDFDRFMDRSKNHEIDADEPEDEVAAHDDPAVDGADELGDFSGEDNLGADEDILPRTQSRDSAKKAAHAIAAMRKPATSMPSDNIAPDMTDQDMQTAVDTKDIPATEPGLSSPVISPPAGGGSTKKPDLNLVRGDKAVKARDWIAQNPDAKRGAFMKWAAENVNMGPHYANTFFYANKKKITEFFVIKNLLTGKVLAEGSAYDIPVWTSFEKLGMFEPGILDYFQAKKAQEKLTEFGYKTEIVKKSIDEEQKPVDLKYINMIGKKLKFTNELKEHTAILRAVENDHGYFIDTDGEMWSTELKNIKV